MLVVVESQQSKLEEAKAFSNRMLAEGLVTERRSLHAVLERLNAMGNHVADTPPGEGPRLLPEEEHLHRVVLEHDFVPMSFSLLFERRPSASSDEWACYMNGGLICHGMRTAEGESVETWSISLTGEPGWAVHT